MKPEKKHFLVGKIEPRDITDEMKESYLDYAMSVIVARALPDVRDGLKPVHRRILYSMHEMGLTHSAKFRKSAAIVGDCLGKYHPHGDVAVYDALVRLAQSFSLRYPLVDGQGNFGSIDGDSVAAQRYTEARMSNLAEELLKDIEKDTVNFQDNYDKTRKEPTVLPSTIPQLLLNGTVGIAVGMATNIPPHNFKEVLDAVIYLIENPEASVDDLMKFIKGPDFPTGATIFDKPAIREAYATGKGSIVIRGTAEIVENESGLYDIIISEFPYQVNKAEFVIKVAQLIKDKKIEGIRDLRDESNKEGIRVVIECKKDAYTNKIINQLYRDTQLQTVLHMNMLALVDGIQPRVLSLKQVLEEYIKHRQVVIRRRSEFDLAETKRRLHILDGLKKAIDNIDAVIKVIKKSDDKNQARVNLINKFTLTEIQANAILDMRLSQLAKLQTVEIENELKEKNLLAKKLTDLLASPKKILNVIKDELTWLRSKYGDDRKTKVNPSKIDAFSSEDLIPDEAGIIVITRDGYIKRLPSTTFKTQLRGGKGVMGIDVKETDAVEQFFSTTAHCDLLFFTTRGRVFKLKAYEVPLASRTAKGSVLVNFLQLGYNEKVSAVLSIHGSAKGQYKHVVMVTKNGVIKKVNIDSFDNVRRSGLIVLKLKQNDDLEWVKQSTGKDEIVLITSLGQCIRFKESNIRVMGRNAGGVRGIRLKGLDVVIGMDIVYTQDPKQKDHELLIVTSLGFGKRTSLSQYRLQGRGGSGIKTAKITSKIGKIIKGVIISGSQEELEVVIISQKGQVIRLPYKSVSKLSRSTQGVRLIRIKDTQDNVASVAII